MIALEERIVGQTSFLWGAHHIPARERLAPCTQLDNSCSDSPLTLVNLVCWLHWALHFCVFSFLLFIRFRSSLFLSVLEG